MRLLGLADRSLREMAYRHKQLAKDSLVTRDQYCLNNCLLQGLTEASIGRRN
jgi:hypothetical protein